MSVLKSEFAAVRTELLRLEGRVAALEEQRNTLRAEMERVKAETNAELRAQIAEYKAEIITRFASAPASQNLPASKLPQIEKPSPGEN